MKVEDYNVRERTEFIKFMKYAGAAGEHNGSLHDAEFYDKEVEACVQ